MSFGTNTKGFLDTKDFRRCVLEKANERLGVIVRSIQEGNGSLISKNTGMLSLLDSTYKSDVPSTLHAMHLKSIAYESGRFLCSLEESSSDIYFETTRGEYLSQTIAEYLFPGSRFAHTNSTDEEVRNFYLSIIEAYFGGSTPENIEKSVRRFVGVPVGIVENYLLTRNDSTLDPIVNKFTFDIVIQVDDPRIKDVTKLQEDIEFLLDIIKPAHTTYETKFIFTELFDIFRKGCIPLIDNEGFPVVSYDGFDKKIKKANTAICDSTHIDYYDYFLEDLRKDEEYRFVIPVEREIVQKLTDEELKTIQANPRLVKTIEGGNWDYPANEYLFHTRFGPFANKEGTELADSPTDITVFINGVITPVLEIYPLSSTFCLEFLPNENDVVEVTYNILKDYVSPLMTNDFDSVINNWKNSATELNYKTVLFPTNFNVRDITIFEQSCKYKGFDLFNSSVLNSPISLNYNEAGLRNKLNDYTVFKSFGYDHDMYISKFREGVTPVAASLNQKEVWRRLPYQEIRMNNMEFIMNNREDRLYGELHYPDYHPFFSSLEFECIDNGGEHVHISTIHEDSKNGLQLNLGMMLSASGMQITRDYECQFYTFSSRNPSGAYDVYFTTLNDTNCTLMGGNATWDFGDTITDNPSGNIGGNHTQAHITYNELIPEEYELTEILEVIDEDNFILKNKEYINEVYRVTNVSRSNYNLLRYNIYSHLVLDITKKINISIGMNSTDSIVMEYAYNNTKYEVDFNVIDSNNMFLGFSKEFPSDFKVVNKTKKYNYCPDYELSGYLTYSQINLDKNLPINTSIGIDSGDEIEVIYFDPFDNSRTELVEIIDLNNLIFKTRVPVEQLISVYNKTKENYYSIRNRSISHFVKVDNRLYDNIKIGLRENDDIEIIYIDVYDQILTTIATFNNTTDYIFRIDFAPKIITSIKNLSRIPEYDLHFANDFSIINLEKNSSNNNIGMDASDLIEIVYSTYDNEIISEATEILDVVEFRLKSSKVIYNLRSVENKTKHQYYFIDEVFIQYCFKLNPQLQLSILEDTDTVRALYLDINGTLQTEYLKILNSNDYSFYTEKAIYHDVSLGNHLQLLEVKNISQECFYDLENSNGYSDIQLDESLEDNARLGISEGDHIEISYKTSTGEFVEEQARIIADYFSLGTSKPVQTIFDIKNYSSASYDLTGIIIADNEFKLDNTISKNISIGVELDNSLLGKEEDLIDVFYKNKSGANRVINAHIEDPLNFVFSIGRGAHSVEKIERDGEQFDLTNMQYVGDLIYLDPQSPINQQLGLNVDDSLLLHRTKLDENRGLDTYSQIEMEILKNLQDETAYHSPHEVYFDNTFILNQEETTEIGISVNSLNPGNPYSVSGNIPQSPSYTTLNFITHKKILIRGVSDSIYENNENIIGVSSVVNVTRGSGYSLDGIEIFKQRVIRLDADNPLNASIGYHPKDEIAITYTHVDTVNEYEELISVVTPQGVSCSGVPHYSFLSPKKITQVLEMFIVIEDPAEVKELDITGYEIVDDNLIVLNEALQNYPLEKDSLVFFRGIALNEVDCPSPTLTYSHNNLITTLIDIGPLNRDPSNPYYY